MKYLLFTIALFCSHNYAQEALEQHFPKYPESPICRDDAGDIVLSYYILESGKPHKIEIEKTESLRFSRSAIKALAKYRFKLGTYSTTLKYEKTFTFKPEHKCGDQA